MRYLNELKKVTVEVDVYKVFTLLFAFVITFQSYIIATSNSNTKTIIVPSNQSKPFTLVENKLSKDYFDDVGFLLVSALVNVSPENVKSSFEKVAKYFSTEPTHRKKIIDELLVHAQNITDNNISQIFYPKEVLVNFKNNVFTVIGTYKTLDGNILTGSRKSTVDFHYEIQEGKLVIVKFEIK